MEHLNTNTIHNTRHFACIVLYGTQPNSDFWSTYVGAGSNPAGFTTKRGDGMHGNEDNP